MRAAAPQRAFSLLVTLQADRVVVLWRTARVVRPEGDDSADPAAAAGGDMRRAWTVTRLAPGFLLGVAGILQEDLAHDGLAEASTLVRMAACADLRPDIGGILGVYWLCRLRLGLCGISRFRLRGFGKQKWLAFRRRRIVSCDLAHEFTERQVGLVAGWHGMVR
jgi:hypothetical protein